MTVPTSPGAVLREALRDIDVQIACPCKGDWKIQTVMGAHRVSVHKFTLAWIVMTLNDQAGWTREEIADWLESLDLDLTFRGEL